MNQNLKVIDYIKLGRLKKGIEAQVKNGSIFPSILNDQHYLAVLENPCGDRGLYIIRHHRRKLVGVRCISGWRNDNLAEEFFDFYSRQKNLTRDLALS